MDITVQCFACSETLRCGNDEGDENLRCLLCCKHFCESCEEYLCYDCGKCAFCDVGRLVVYENELCQMCQEEEESYN